MRPARRAAPAGSGRIDALDGLRALAVVLVVGYHLSGALPGGYLGVDVFFVLSGYLITDRLLAERRRTGRIELAGFYRRRLRRLYPALLAMCAVVAVAAAVTGRHTGAVELGVLTTVGYVANLWQFSGHDTYLLQHTWTLALEEQFYLLWPLLLRLLGSGRRLAGVVVPALAAVLLADLLAGRPGVLHSYVRAGGLVLGCALALGLAGPRADRWLRLRPAAGPCLLALVVLAAVPAELGAWLAGWPIGLAAVLTVPVLVALSAPGRLSRTLARPWPVWIGRRSYGIYLWHFPILALLLAHLPQVPVALREAAAVALTVLVAAASFRWIEQPLLLRRRRPVTDRSPGDAPAARPA